MSSGQQTSGNQDIEKYTREDEEKMDRAAQAGMEGAFDAGDQNVEEQVKRDAEQAFSQQNQGGNSGNTSSGS